MEDCGKEYHMGRVNFQVHLPPVKFLDLVYHRGSKYCILEVPQSLSTSNLHSPCIRCFLNLPQGVCGRQMELPIATVDIDLPLKFA